MKMILNFFSNVVTKKKLVVFFSLSSLIVGCTDLYNYNTPAPVYKSKRPTNPYEQKTIDVDGSVEDIEPGKIIEEPFEPELTPFKPEVEEKAWDWPTNSTNRNKQNVPVANKSLSPVILSLVAEADNSSKAGDLDSAVVTIERALRIDSRNPLLTYKLAALRLQQSKPRLAEDLAQKAALLSANDKALKRQAWLLISEARKQQKNYHGAKEAKLKANNI